MKWLTVILTLALGLPFFPQFSLAYDFVQVSGEGEIKAKPDFILVNATVYSRAQTAKEAQKINTKEMARIDKLLKQDFKVEAKDIQTSSFQVQPQYEYGKDKPIYKGINVQHALRIKFRKVDEVGNLLDRLVEVQNQEGFGVRVDELVFGTDQSKAYEVQALELAMNEAKARAQVLAKASGRTLSTVRKVSDSQISEIQIRPMRSMGKMAMDMASETAPTQVSPGEISVRAQVSVEYEIK
ncbi:MAG: SIMPL domain-containing protein [Pseudobdellovibrionaceae bacterium]